MTLQLKKRLMPHGEAAIATLVNLLRDEDSQVKLKAATQILDRVYGRPKQVVEASLDATRILDALLARLQGPPAPARVARRRAPRWKPMATTTELADWRWRIAHLYSCIAKDGRRVPFVSHAIQRRFSRGLGRKNATLKGRQIGSSTAVALLALDCCLWTPDFAAGLPAQTESVGRKRLQKRRDAHPHWPDELQKRTPLAGEYITRPVAVPFAAEPVAQTSWGDGLLRVFALQNPIAKSTRLAMGLREHVVRPGPWFHERKGCRPLQRSHLLPRGEVP